MKPAAEIMKEKIIKQTLINLYLKLLIMLQQKQKMIKIIKKLIN
jgi:hypothetical protein